MERGAEVGQTYSILVLVNIHKILGSIQEPAAKKRSG